MTTWTTQDIPSQHGRLALVTGANSGLGRITALELARAGAAVVLAGRSAESLRRAAAEIGGQVPGAELVPVRLDLADLVSVEEAAAAVLALGRPLDLLVNNAGVMAVPERRTTADGFELTFGTNHLGHFAFTGRVLPVLLKAPAARVVTVSAMAARWKSGVLTDLMSEERYTPMGAYAKSKRANVVFSQELDRRAAGTALRAYAVHPGSADTGIQRHGGAVVRRLSSALLPLLANTPEGAALPSLYAATHEDLPARAFIGPTGFHEGRGTPAPVSLPAGADDPEEGRRLWETSERLTRVTYDFR